ncbi:MAG TPA: hypothetical protein VEA99_14625 [Gemmatimonadaceae bacterium]|nr:hypothetical protein [Gemmatimonadaceae bacterium]
MRVHTRRVTIAPLVVALSVLAGVLVWRRVRGRGGIGPHARAIARERDARGVDRALAERYERYAG